MSSCGGRTAGTMRAMVVPKKTGFRTGTTAHIVLRGCERALKVLQVEVEQFGGGLADGDQRAEPWIVVQGAVRIPLAPRGKSVSPVPSMAAGTRTRLSPGKRRMGVVKLNNLSGKSGRDNVSIP